MPRPPQTVGWNVDNEIDFINALAAGLKGRALVGYLKALRVRALGFKGEPMNEGVRSQLIARVQQHMVDIDAHAAARRRIA